MPRFPVSCARKIDEDLPHQTGGDGKEVRTAVPFHRYAAHEPNESLVNQGRRLQEVSGAFTRQIEPSDAVQFGIDDGRQAIERGCIPVAPGFEHTGQLGRGRTLRRHRKSLSSSS